MRSMLAMRRGMATTRTTFLLLWLMVFMAEALLGTATIFEDYEQCRDHAQFGQPNGTLVCDPEGRLQPRAVEQLQAMLKDLEQNVPCDCAEGCQREAGKGDHFMALLVVSSAERVEQSGGEQQIADTSKRIWDDAGMGNEKCDNGMLLVYVRDERKMATYQGHASGHDRFKVFSDQEIANLHELAMNGANGTSSVAALPLGDFGSSGGANNEAKQEGDGAEVRRADESWAPVVGLSIALALTFLVLVILLVLLLAKCCRLCCPSPSRKASKYYVNPMPSYKSIEPIYIVTPAGSEAAAFAAPPSGASLYGTGTFGRHHRHHPPPMMHPHGVYGPPPPPPPMHVGPLVHHPSRSRSITPTSTQRIHRTYHPSGSGGPKLAQSIHSTPEANKRDKVNRTMTVHSNGGTGTSYYSAQNTPESGIIHPSSSQAPKKKLSHPPPTIHEAELPQHHQQPFNSQPPPPLPFLDPWRKQEVQTREEFIG